ncbi:restriction endonuclease subunit S [Chryseobacterium oryzae]|uniref:Restriction endonuclease subunit S n=1 Tax=Chryseobacterium oryzae TaxID=2929799 RepID=A0ABY4BPQ7_9FLAO|nr:restriction endonuclease subunit S [Chryseobacterium oryzae]UOE39703.1 restriction endonuclease subunit S [Chryseobacterium oryzae]
MERVKLGDIFTIKKGKKVIEDDNGKFNYVTIENLHSKKYRQKTNEVGIQVNESDILIAWDGANAGLVGFNLSGTIGSTLAQLKVNSSFKDKINPAFVYQYLDSKFDLIKSKRTGATIPHVNGAELRSMQIPIPTLDIQKAIATKLDKAQEIITYNQQLIEKYDQLTQSLFIDMFGDPVRNEKGFVLEKLEKFYISQKEGTKCGPFGGALKKEEFVESGIPVWNMDNISKNGKLVDNINLWITEEKYDALSSYSVINNDIIISRAGTVGKMCVVNTLFDNSIISTNLIRLRLNKDLLLPIYFVSLMTYFKEKISRLKTGSEGAFTHMNTGVLNNIIFPYPPITLQNQFAERIEKIEAQKQMAQESLAKSEELFQSLLQESFK